MVFLAMKSAQSVNQLATVEGVRTATGRKQCWFYPTFFGGASLLRRLLDHIRHSFQGRYLVNYFFEQQVSLANPTLSVSVAATVPIGYRIRVLEVIGAVKHMTNLACVPPKQARMDSTKVTNYKLNSTHAHGLG